MASEERHDHAGPPVVVSSSSDIVVSLEPPTLDPPTESVEVQSVVSPPESGTEVEEGEVEEDSREEEDRVERMVPDAEGETEGPFATEVPEGMTLDERVEEDEEENNGDDDQLHNDQSHSSEVPESNNNLDQEQEQGANYKDDEMELVVESAVPTPAVTPSKKGPKRKRVKIEDDEPHRASRFKGVCWYRQRRKWQASIYMGGRKKHLGYFDREEDAARAYDRAAGELYGFESESVVYNFNPWTGERNPKAKRRGAGAAGPSGSPRPPSPPVALPLPVLPPQPALQALQASAGSGVIRHALLTTDQPLPPPSLHRLAAGNGSMDEEEQEAEHEGLSYDPPPMMVTRGRRQQLEETRREREHSEDEEGAEQEDDDTTRGRRFTKRARASSSPRTLGFTPWPPQLPYSQASSPAPALPPPDPTTPHLITVASLLLDMIFSSKDEERKTKLKALLKTVAKGGSTVRVMVGAAVDGQFTHWDLKEEVDKREKFLTLLMELQEAGDFDDTQRAQEEGCTTTDTNHNQERSSCVI